MQPVPNICKYPTFFQQNDSWSPKVLDQKKRAWLQAVKATDNWAKD